MVFVVTTKGKGMKLLFIAPSAYLLGGVQDWLYLTVLGLRQRGHSVKVGIPDGTKHDGKRYSKCFPGLEAEFFRNNSGTNEGRNRGIQKFLEKNKAEIVIGVNIGNLFEVIARESMSRNYRFAVTLHAIEANYFADIRQYSSHIDGVITTNRLSQHLVSKIGNVGVGRVFYAPYGIDIRRTSREYVNESSHVRIAWVGRLEKEQKRVNDLLEILRDLDQLGLSYKLSIAGDGPAKDEILNKLVKWIERGSVRYMGILGKRELIDFYQENDILLITSEWETGPIVAWEAIDAGLGVVSSNYIGSKSEGTLVDGETALLFKVGDSAEAAEKIAKIMNNKLRITLNANAQSVVSTKYSTIASLDAWEKAFEEIMSKKVKKEMYRVSKEWKKSRSDRLERYAGGALSEILRTILPKRKPKDAGSEWPHSLQGISDQSWILDYARQIENDC